MFLNDIDPQFIKSVNYLYSSDNLVKGDTVPLQFYLEEAIKNKIGVSKDLTGVVTTSFKHRRINEFKPFINAVEESRGSSSDNELELDLFKEDLMCIVCNGMDVGARNRLLECSDCHMLYHQECHKPIVTNQDSFDSWVCQNCKDASKKIKVTTSAPTASTTTHGKVASSSASASASSSSSTSSLSATTNTKPASGSSSHRHSNPYKSGNSSSKNDKYSKSNTSSSSKSSSSSTSKPASSSSSTSRTVTPNINIISADKRIQIMKKKAAKLQERRLTRLAR